MNRQKNVQSQKSQTTRPNAPAAKKSKQTVAIVRAQVALDFDYKIVYPDPVDGFDEQPESGSWLDAPEAHPFYFDNGDGFVTAFARTLNYSSGRFDHEIRAVVADPPIGGEPLGLDALFDDSSDRYQDATEVNGTFTFDAIPFVGDPFIPQTVYMREKTTGFPRRSATFFPAIEIT